MQIYIPVLRNAHWTIYALNRIHEQIDILDLQEWPRLYDMNKYHQPICKKMRTGLEAVLQRATARKLPSIKDWTFTYVDVPKMAPQYDCAIWCTLYLENYNPVTRQMDRTIIKVTNCLVTCVFLSQQMFIQEVTTMGFFLCVYRIMQQTTGLSFSTTCYGIHSITLKSHVSLKSWFPSIWDVRLDSINCRCLV